MTCKESLKTSNNVASSSQTDLPLPQTLPRVITVKHAVNSRPITTSQVGQIAASVGGNRRDVRSGDPWTVLARLANKAEQDLPESDLVVASPEQGWPGFKRLKPPSARRVVNVYFFQRPRLLPAFARTTDILGNDNEDRSGSLPMGDLYRE
ncbi:hypothetical protein BDY19DRAFT_1003158 [Irpex rosettiformis]|uniref:Uncharacterized protein n=1 Tax=Irpex rosettiformis TaxID=378272 RepID=A0ACB8U749_9APHY|nr:hypothetical protein BDY19DRAFT_1003158 [Irpex rosettiformis]